MLGRVEVPSGDVSEQQARQVNGSLGKFDFWNDLDSHGFQNFNSEISKKRRKVEEMID